MTPEHQVLLEIRDMISQIPEDDRIRVESIAMTLRNIVRGGGKHAETALALVGAEMADQA